MLEKVAEWCIDYNLPILSVLAVGNDGKISKKLFDWYKRKYTDKPNILIEQLKSQELGKIREHNSKDWNNFLKELESRVSVSK